tara:strand:+ start:70 stop:642 length:573 start_codon:yes stop_codon:yes gene_type:complete
MSQKKRKLSDSTEEFKKKQCKVDDANMSIQTSYLSSDPNECWNDFSRARRQFDKWQCTHCQYINNPLLDGTLQCGMCEMHIEYKYSDEIKFKRNTKFKKGDKNLIEELEKFFPKITWWFDDEANIVLHVEDQYSGWPHIDYDHDIYGSPFFHSLINEFDCEFEWDRAATTIWISVPRKYAMKLYLKYASS